MLSLYKITNTLARRVYRTRALAASYDRTYWSLIIDGAASLTIPYLPENARPKNLQNQAISVHLDGVIVHGYEKFIFLHPDVYPGAQGANWTANILLATLGMMLQRERAFPPVLYIQAGAVKRYTPAAPVVYS